MRACPRSTSTINALSPQRVRSPPRVVNHRSNRMLRKFLTGVVALTLALGTVALTATPANAGRDDAPISALWGDPT